MKELIPYLRVGTIYYKQVEKPLLSGDSVTFLARWNKETIINDHGKEYFNSIPKYDGFTCIPSHLNYQQVIDNFYNTYNELPHEIIENINAEKVQDEITYSMRFMYHIFGEQLEIGLDYLKILFEEPSQMLPILCLVSKERATGKSTFIKWLKEIFSLNMTYIKGDSFGSQFNADWASMLIVAIDEVFFDKKEITERLKYLSTTNKDKLEAKGKDRVEIDFFAKFILCSNNEENFIQIDENEIRFWIRKVNTISVENTNYLSLLIKEIPYFIYFLKQRSFSTRKKTRMWFSADEIKTKALLKLMYKNNNQLELLIIESLYEYFQTSDNDIIQAVPNDLLNIVKRMFNSAIYSRNDVRKILKSKWKFEPKNNALSYVRLDIDYSGNFCENNSTGRYYTIHRDFILQKFDELLN